MNWKAIGCSVIGGSHVATGKPCEDAINYKIVTDINGNEVLLCCVSDGAGSALYAGYASAYCTENAVAFLSAIITAAEEINEGHIFGLAETLYDGLAAEAANQGVEINEYSCTFLGCCLSPTRSVFFQVGDGAIVKNDGSGFYIPVWWPDNGEYQNTTSFLVDNDSFSQLHICVVEEKVDEIAIFSDGLQMLALNMDLEQAHQPFFTDLFKYLRQATDADKINVLDRKLAGYLNSKPINDRTGDDKTLFLATRVSP